MGNNFGSLIKISDGSQISAPLNYDEYLGTLGGLDENSTGDDAIIYNQLIENKLFGSNEFDLFDIPRPKEDKLFVILRKFNNNNEYEKDILVRIPTNISAYDFARFVYSVGFGTSVVVTFYDFSDYRYINEISLTSWFVIFGLLFSSLFFTERTKRYQIGLFSLFVFVLLLIPVYPNDYVYYTNFESESPFSGLRKLPYSLAKSVKHELLRKPLQKTNRSLSDFVVSILNNSNNVMDLSKTYGFDKESIHSNGIISSKIYSEGGFDVEMNFVPKNVSTGEHTHNNDVYVITLCDSLIMSLDNSAEKIARKGQVILIKAGKKHYARSDDSRGNYFLSIYQTNKSLLQEDF